MFKRKQKTNVHHFRGRKGRETFFTGRGLSERPPEGFDSSIIFATDLPEAAARRYAWPKVIDEDAEVDATGADGDDRDATEDFVDLGTGMGIFDCRLFFELSASAVDLAIFACEDVDARFSYSGGDRLSSVDATEACKIKFSKVRKINLEK